MMKNQKGITLIALVITIIVLLILAGVSIAMLTGENGIITKAGLAEERSTEGAKLEAVKLAIAEILADKYDPSVTDTTKKEISKTNIETIITRDNANSSWVVADLDLTNTPSDDAPTSITFTTDGTNVYTIDIGTGKITPPAK